MLFGHPKRNKNLGILSIIIDKLSSCFSCSLNLIDMNMYMGIFTSYSTDKLKKLDLKYFPFLLTVKMEN